MGRQYIGISRINYMESIKDKEGKNDVKFNIKTKLLLGFIVLAAIIYTGTTLSPLAVLYGTPLPGVTVAPRGDHMTTAEFKAKARTFLLVGYAFNDPADKAAFDKRLAGAMLDTKHLSLLDDLGTDKRDASILAFLDALDYNVLEDAR
jgi:hypothetical protein